jgi:hypothetical protein
MSVNWRSVMKSRRPAGARRKSPRSLASCDGIFAVGDGESEADRAGVGDWASSVDGVEEAGDPARRVEDGTDLLGRKTPVRSVDNNSHKPRRSRFHRLQGQAPTFGDQTTVLLPHHLHPPCSELLHATLYRAAC